MTKPQLKRLLGQMQKIKTSIRNLELDLLEYDIATKSMDYSGDRVSCTNKISNKVLDEVIRREEKRIQLEKKIQELKILDERIRNLTSALNETQRLLIENIYFKNKSMDSLESEGIIPASRRTLERYHKQSLDILMQVVNSDYIYI